MSWGKTAKSCGTAGGMDNGVPIDSVGGSAQEPVNLEDTEEHDVPPFAGDSSHTAVTRSAACKREIRWSS
jgi:hypothetical protein